MQLMDRLRRFWTTKLHQQTRPQADALEPRCLLTVTFATPVQYTGVIDVTGIAAGDLSGDARPDVVVGGLAPVSQNPVIGVYLNHGNGTFGTPTIIPLNGTPAGIALGDFAGRGKLDVAAVDASTNRLDVFLNDGNGNLSQGAGADLGGTSGDRAIAAGDFNGDGKDDVAVVDPNDQDVQTLFNNGNGFGSFTQEQDIGVPLPENVIVGDFNGDTHPDLAVLSGNGSIYVALNQGGGTFAAPVAYPLGPGLTSTTGMAMADFNGDTLNDLAGVGASATGGTAGVLLNQAAGVFGTAGDIATAVAPVAVVAGDFSVDGHPDIVLLSAAGALLDLPGNGGGTFGDTDPVFSNQLGSVGTQAVTADFNGDGSPDIAVVTSSGGFAVTLDTTAGLPVNPVTLSPTLIKNTLPISATGGIAAHGAATIDVTNSTTATVKGPVTVALYASNNGSIDRAAVLLGSVKKTLTIKAGATAPVSLPVKLPTTLGAGTYTLLAQTIDPSANVTAAASGPALTVAAPFISLAESFQKLALPTAVVSGTKASVVASLRITNSGNVASNGTTTIALYASPDGLASDATLIKTFSKKLVIAAGKSVIVPVPLGAYPSVANGNYFLLALVTDPHGVATSVASTTTVNIAAAFIDLAGIIISIPPSAKIGKSVAVTLELTNNGNTPATGPLQIAFAASSVASATSGIALGTLSTHISLKPGASKMLRLSVPLPIGIPSGNTYLIATVDPADAFADSNLSNNVSVSALPLSLG